MSGEGATPVELDALLARVGDGAKIALPPDYSGTAVVAARALARRGVRDLHVVTVPSGGMHVDILIGAGCVATLETAAISLGERGPAPRFTAAVREGSIRLLDSTCPVIHAGLLAAQKGVPFLPLRGVIGSDLMAARPDWRVIDNPFAGGDGPDPIGLFPAIRPDVALFQAPSADRHGNVWIGRRRELMMMAHAARETLACVERIEDGDFLADPLMAPGTIPALYVTAVAIVRRGAHPAGLPGEYAADAGALARYAESARDAQGFQRWLQDDARLAA